MFGRDPLPGIYSVKHADRNAFDYYPTPKWAVKRLLERVDLWPGHWLEPCAGDGAIIRAVNEIRSDVEWSANEIQGRFEAPLATQGASVTIGDYRAWRPAQSPQGPPLVAITNPPYLDALDVIRWAVEEMRIETVVMFVRVGFLGSAERNDWLTAHAPDTYILPDRPQFWRASKGKFQTDNTDYCWLRWFQGWIPQSKGELRILDKTPLTARKADAQEALRYTNATGTAKAPVLPAKAAPQPTDT